jgi:hypothetical protein
MFSVLHQTGITANKNLLGRQARGGIREHREVLATK